MEKKYIAESTDIGSDYKMVHIMTEKGDILLRGAVPNDFADDLINLFNSKKESNHGE